ncbi:MAG TPA: D-TA family PLP-dependent enzyme [Verrucomicrobiae bacterium]|nr:D-TA family PLP-dependent enzyme [Verrucomicrobiae bacterium]
MNQKPWFQIANVAEVDSPALLVYPERVEENVHRMIAIAGGPERLCPHVKTHKLAELIRMQTTHGITKFKCATIAEAEMVASCGAADVVLAHQPVEPKVQRFIQLIKQFPQTSFTTIVDDELAARRLSTAAVQAGVTIKLLLDIDCGMHRSGVAPGPKAATLYRLIASLPGLETHGFHAYDGHIDDMDLALRTRNCEEAFTAVVKLKRELSDSGVPRIIAGGTPTFPIHARRPDVECSPGTTIFWDAGYRNQCPDLDFLNAALVLTRVISKPTENRLCLDLGHKAIAAEKPHPRVQLLNLPDTTAVMHSEEHLVVETSRAHEFSVGDVLYGIPRHICPTVALHAEAVVIKNGLADGKWKVTARDRRLTI